MIIVQFMGGLGNQLFQYALGRRLAHDRGVDLRLDTSYFKTYPLRNYELHHFNIQAPIATAKELRRFRPIPLTRKFKRLVLDRIIPYEWVQVMRERHLGYDPNVLRLGNNVLLRGNWQSEKYFKPVEAMIRAEFTFKSEPSPSNLALIATIQQVNAVSLHVRRGDYVTNPNTAEFIGSLPLDYYQRAVDRMARDVLNPHFFIFSDDPQWVGDNLRLTYPHTFVTHNLPDFPHEDLRLISLCQHHIIANSTFSWWGAWLNSSPNKRVIAPARWFLDASQAYMEDRVPSTWMLI